MAENETSNAIKIAVIQEQVLGLREQHKASNDVTLIRLNALEEKIDELTAIMNRGRGAYAASMALAASIGAVVIEAISRMAAYFHR